MYAGFHPKLRPTSDARLDTWMGCCLSCLQDDTRRAENARIIPMGQELSHYEVRRTRFSHTHTLFQSPFAFPLACSDRTRAASSLRSRRTKTRMAQNQ